MLTSDFNNFFFCREKNNRICSCTLSFCEGVRESHMLRESFVRIPQGVEGEIWCELVKARPELKNPRLCVIHFQPEDIITQHGSDGTEVFVELNRNETLHPYPRYATAKGKPARPTASLTEIKQSRFYISGRQGSFLSNKMEISSAAVGKRTRSNDTRTPARETYELPSTPSVRTKRGFSPAVQEGKRGRPRSSFLRPFSEFCVASSSRIMSLINAVHQHAKGCCGNLIFRRSDTRLDGLTLKVRVTCSQLTECTHCDDEWVGGVLNFTSTSYVALPSGKLCSTANMKMVLASKVNSVRKKHVEDVLRTVQLRPSSRSTQNQIGRAVIDPYINSEFESLERTVCAVYAEKPSNIVSLDLTKLPTHHTSNWALLHRLLSTQASTVAGMHRALSLPLRSRTQ